MSLKNAVRKMTKIGVQGAAFGYGQRKPGVARAPKILRDCKFMEVLEAVVGLDIRDYGDINLGIPEDSSGKDICLHTSHLIRLGDVPARNVSKVATANQKIYESTTKVHKDRRLCLTLGGDHSIAIGTVAGAAAVHRDLGVIWVDAHSDINTIMTSASGNMHGMPLSLLVHEMKQHSPPMPEFKWLKSCISAHDLVYIGLRDVEPDEKTFINGLAIKAYSMADVDKDGIEIIIQKAIQHLTARSPSRPIHVSFDVDALDELEVPCTGTPVPGGLTLREGMHVMETVYGTTNMVSMDLVEFNPGLGSEIEVHRTINSVKEILFSSFGYDRGGMPRFK